MEVKLELNEVAAFPGPAFSLLDEPVAGPGDRHPESFVEQPGAAALVAVMNCGGAWNGDFGGGLPDAHTTALGNRVRLGYAVFREPELAIGVVTQKFLPFGSIPIEFTPAPERDPAQGCESFQRYRAFHRWLGGLRFGCRRIVDVTEEQQGAQRLVQLGRNLGMRAQVFLRGFAALRDEFPVSGDP